MRWLFCKSCHSAFVTFTPKTLQNVWDLWTEWLQIKYSVVMVITFNAFYTSVVKLKHANRKHGCNWWHITDGDQLNFQCNQLIIYYNESTMIELSLLFIVVFLFRRSLRLQFSRFLAFQPQCQQLQLLRLLLLLPRSLPWMQLCR